MLLSVLDLLSAACLSLSLSALVTVRGVQLLPVIHLTFGERPAGRAVLLLPIDCCVRRVLSVFGMPRRLHRCRRPALTSKESYLSLIKNRWREVHLLLAKVKADSPSSLSLLKK